MKHFKYDFKLHKNSHHILADCSSQGSLRDYFFLHGQQTEQEVCKKLSDLDNATMSKNTTKC